MPTLCLPYAYACRLVAHHYYNTMLNAPHINIAMWTAMLCLVLAAARGLEASRGTPKAPGMTPCMTPHDTLTPCMTPSHRA